LLAIFLAGYWFSDTHKLTLGNRFAVALYPQRLRDRLM